MQNGKIGNCIVRVGFGKGDNYASVDAQAMQPTRAIWVGNISSSTTPAALQSVFSAFGPIESARVLTHKNCGFVNFEKLEDAVRAKKAMNGKEIADSVVRIGYAKVPSKSDLSGRSRVASAASPLPSQLLTPWATPAVTVDPSLNPEDVLEPGASFIIDEQLVAYNYLSSIPPLPEPQPHQRLDQARLREIRKRLDGHPTQRDVDTAFEELFGVSVELCTDYIGNTIVQKFMERCSPEQKQRLIESVAPHTASIGTHKNGTWAIQKMVETATTSGQMLPFVMSIKPTTPPLMLDQLGNYVVQCCLRFGPQRNQFIFDAIHARCWEIAQGRFGARAIRTCLEHQLTTRKQQKLVVISLVNNAVSLTTNANGSLLINWLLDSSGFHGRFRVLAPRLADHLGHLCTHKLGSLVVLKIINQRTELDARDLLLGRLFFDPSSAVLEDVLSDQVHGVSIVQKILAGNSLNESQKQAIAENVKNVLARLQVFAVQGYRRLLEEI
ncbi:armadillo-type protein, partial [Dimargaris cristalligena]